MNIILNNTKSNYFEIFSLEDLDNIHKTFRKFFSIKGPVEENFISQRVNKYSSIIKIKKSFGQS